MNSRYPVEILSKVKYFPCYQPIVDVCTSQIAGYECLARTRDANDNIVSAGWLFSDSSVRTQTKLEIDRKVRNQALDYTASNPDNGLIFINISPVLMSSLKLGETPPSIKHLRKIDLDPSRVVFEITEKVGDSKLLDRFVKIYRDEGVKIAIDDFGIEGSQIDRLVAYSPDYLKIDMGMFKNASRKGKSSSVILSLAELADRSGCQILCEGVETEEEYHFALECGARKVQGWLFDQAREKHLDRFTFSESITHYQASYLKRKRQKIIESYESSEKLTGHLEELVECYKRDDFSNIDTTKLRQLGVVRIFECDFSGKQVSPNYLFTKDGLQVDFRCRGRNWAHRPYFTLLLGLYQTVDHRQIVSSAYIDRATKLLCKTRGLILDGSRVLFIDTQTIDETLYCEAG